jgi:hypothetical protein
VRCNGQLTDSLGQLGYDPGAGWSSDTAPQLTTKDSHWLRCSGPDLQATDPFFIDAQWVLYPEGEELEAAPARCPTHLGPGGAAAQ